MARRTSKIHADAFYTFVMIFGEWKAFLGLMAVMIVMAFLVVGLPEEFDGAMGVLFTLIFVMGWLATIYMLRQKLAGEEVRLRDGLFKSMAPLIPTLIMLMVVVLECVPVMATVVAWSSAVETHFLDMPFNALMLIVLTVAMVLLSGFLLTSSLLALVAVGTPGIYPVMAILTARELVAKNGKGGGENDFALNSDSGDGRSCGAIYVATVFDIFKSGFSSSGELCDDLRGDVFVFIL